MGENITWVAILGAVSGVLASLGWVVRYIVGLVKKPKLVISEGPYVANWHFIGTTNVWQFINLEVINKRGKTAYRCIAKASVIKHPPNVNHLVREYALHWADVSYSGRSTGAEPIEIGAVPQRLDVVFTVPGHKGESYLTMPIALLSPGNIPQATLPKGEYIMKVIVLCENGRGDSKIIKVISPDVGKDLQAEEIKRIPWCKRIWRKQV